MNKDKGNNTFWEEHRKCFLIAAAVMLAGAVIIALIVGAKPKRKIVDHITAEYTGDTKAGVVLDDKNTGFIVTAYFKDDHSEKVTGWTIAEPQTLKDAEVSVVTITYQKASTQCEVQCTSGLIQSITAEYDGGRHFRRYTDLGYQSGHSCLCDPGREQDSRRERMAGRQSLCT